MNKDGFWEIIEKIKSSDDKASAIKTELAQLPLDEVASYQENFDAVFNETYRWELWGAAYIIGGGCSDDGFTDFRYGLISMGQEIFDHAIENPDFLASLGDEVVIDEELFGYAAMEYVEEKSGKDFPKKERVVASEPLGEEWDFDDEIENRNRLPELMKLHW